MIEALWSNSNYDQDNARQDAIEDIEEKCEEAIELVLFGAEPEEEVEDKYGFFAAGKKGQEKILESRDDEGTTVKEIVDYGNVDQQ